VNYFGLLQKSKSMDIGDVGMDVGTFTSPSLILTFRHGLRIDFSPVLL